MATSQTLKKNYIHNSRILHKNFYPKFEMLPFTSITIRLEINWHIKSLGPPVAKKVGFLLYYLFIANKGYIGTTVTQTPLGLYRVSNHRKAFLTKRVKCFVTEM